MVNAHRLVAFAAFCVYVLGWFIANALVGLHSWWQTTLIGAPFTYLAIELAFLSKTLKADKNG